jgi:hypothetical protein
VPEVDGEDLQKPTTVANDPLKRWRGGKGSADRVEERVNFAYSLLLEGDTRRSNSQRIADRFGVSIRTADSDISKAQELLRTEQTDAREDLLKQITASRLSLVRRCMKRHNYQVAAHVLDSLARGLGEGTAFDNAAQAPQLQITIDDRRNSQ